MTLSTALIRHRLEGLFVTEQGTVHAEPAMPEVGGREVARRAMDGNAVILIERDLHHQAPICFDDTVEALQSRRKPGDRRQCGKAVTEKFLEGRRLSTLVDA